MSRIHEVYRLLLPERPPLLSLVGFGIAIAGLGLDAVAHLAGSGDHHHAGFSGSEHAAHLVGLIGMLIALSGVVIDGARRAGSHTTSNVERSSNHAHR
jgi:hypothetical protein